MVAHVVTGSTDKGATGELGLKSVKYGGLIREDVMEKIWDISNVPLPFTSRVGSDTHDNEYTEWVVDELAAPSTTNKVVDGADIDQDDNKVGERQGNHSQISVKEVKVSQRAQNSNTIGGNALSYQLMNRQKELRRDVEAACLAENVSIADNGTDAGQVGSLATWIKTSVANGTGGGFSTATGKTTAPTATKAGMTEKMVRDVCQSIHENGGSPQLMMAPPKAIRNFSEYLFTSSARVGTITNDQGATKSAMVANGSVNVFVTDFDVVLDLVSNIIQQPEADGSVNAFILDPSYIDVSFLEGYRVEPLAKTGLADKRMMKVDWSLKVRNEKAQGIIFHVDPAIAVAAG